MLGCLHPDHSEDALALQVVCVSYRKQAAITQLKPVFTRRILVAMRRMWL